MAHKISPDRIANPVTMIAWDGSDFYAVKCDNAGRLVVGIGLVTIGAITIADGDDVTLGAVADAAANAGGAGTLSAKLRRLTDDLDAILALTVSINAAAVLIEGNIDDAEANMIRRATTPTFSNVTMTNADQEYSHELPANCMKFLIKCRGLYDLKVCRIATESGSTYLTVPAGMSYYEDLIQTTGKTLYFQCATAAQVAEIVTWN